MDSSNSFNSFKESLKVNCNSRKNVQLTRMKNFVKAELKHIFESDLYEDDEKLEDLNVLHNMWKILNNYDELEPILQEFFKDKYERSELNGRDR